jgi:hypothetical protein
LDWTVFMRFRGERRMDPRGGQRQRLPIQRDRRRVMCDPLNDLLGKAGVCNAVNRRVPIDHAHAHVRYGL